MLKKLASIVLMVVFLLPTLSLALVTTTTYKPNRALNLNYIPPKITTTAVNNMVFDYQLQKIQSKTPISVIGSHINMKRSIQINYRNMRKNT